VVNGAGLEGIEFKAFDKFFIFAVEFQLVEISYFKISNYSEVLMMSFQQ
jgi:hypothetical protein